MADGAEIEDLARRYLDLWQDQVAALAADPEFTEALGRLMGSAGLSGAAPGSLLATWPTLLNGFMRAGDPEQANDGTTSGHGDGTRGEGTRGDGQAGDGQAADGRGTPGTEAPATAPDPGHADLEFLLGRLTALEERIAELEGGAGDGGRGAEPGAGGG